MVLPGFQDGHVHPIDSGVQLGECALDDLETASEVVDTIRAYALAHPDLKWVRGNGWQLPVFKNGNPSKAELDAAIPDRPALFYAADGHSAWVNSKALQLAGITRATADPATGASSADRGRRAQWYPPGVRDRSGRQNPTGTNSGGTLGRAPAGSDDGEQVRHHHRPECRYR